MKTTKLKESILIEGNIEKVFDYTQDYEKRLHWDTFLIKAYLIGGATKADKGIKAYCVASNGLGMVTEYITFNRPKVVAVKMTKGPFMFKLFVGSRSFKQIDSHITEVIFLYSIIFRFPFNMATNFVKRNFQNNVKQRLIDLKNNIENKVLVA